MGRAKGSLKAALQNHTRAAKQAEELARKGNHQMELQLAHKQKLKRKASGTARPRAPWIPFNPRDCVVLIGEGDFSFAVACLANDYSDHLVCTGLDSRDELVAKYSTSAANLEALEDDERAQVMHQVDVTELARCKPLIQALAAAEKAAQQPTFDDEPPKRTVFLFNFPHLGNSVKDQDRNIRQHQELVVAYFSQVKAIAPNALVGLTIFDGEPYQSWEIKRLARSQGYKLDRSGRFEWDAFEGYTHKLTAKDGRTNKDQRTRGARIYLFAPEPVSEPEPEPKSKPEPKQKQKA